VSDELPEYLKLKILKKWMSEAKHTTTNSQQQADPEKLVWSKLSDDRAVELLSKVKELYPEAYPTVIRVFYELLSRGLVSELDGYTVYSVLQKLGIPVKPEVRIKFVKHGKEVSMKEYLE